MKTRSLIAMAVALAIHGAAFAETSVEQQQDGTGNFALVEQLEGGDNSVLQYQLGDDHVSQIYQAGTGLSASTAQSGLRQFVEINQTGAASEATTTQAGQDNRVTIFQANTWGPNVVAVEQDGTSNLAGIDQRGPRSGWVDVAQLGGGNMLMVEQLGEINSVSVVQEGVGHYGEIQQDWASSASLTQRGNNSYASIRQGSDSGTFIGATVIQDGDRNWASVSQGGGDMGAGINLSQTGDDNIARIDQFGDSASITFAQVGTANDLDIDQSGSALSISGSSNGTGNEVSLSQSGWTSSAMVEQVGDGNIATIDQNGAFGSYLNAAIFQNGGLNEATITQTSLPFDGGHAATIQQTGTGNVASISQ